MIEPALYALVLACWLFWVAARTAEKVDVALGIIVAVVATLLALRGLYLVREAVLLSMN